MKLWLISQDKVGGFDSYGSAVVAAKTKTEARNIHPSESKNWDTSTWCHPRDVDVEYLGMAKRGIQAGVICASFFAG